MTSMWWAVSDRDYEAARTKHDEPRTTRTAHQPVCSVCSAPATASIPGRLFCSEHLQAHTRQVLATYARKGDAA